MRMLDSIPHLPLHRCIQLWRCSAWEPCPSTVACQQCHHPLSSPSLNTTHTGSHARTSSWPHLHRQLLCRSQGRASLSASTAAPCHLAPLPSTHILRCCQVHYVIFLSDSQPLWGTVLWLTSPCSHSPFPLSSFISLLIGFPVDSLQHDSFPLRSVYLQLCCSPCTGSIIHLLPALLSFPWNHSLLEPPPLT